MKLRTFLKNELKAGRMVRGWKIPPSDYAERFEETLDSYYNRDLRVGCIIGLASHYLGLECSAVEEGLEQGNGGKTVAIERNDAGFFEEAIDLVCAVWDK